MSRKDDYRRRAKQQSDDAEDLESGRWRWFVNDDDVSTGEATRKRGLAARLFGWAKDDDD